MRINKNKNRNIKIIQNNYYNQQNYQNKYSKKYKING